VFVGGGTPSLVPAGKLAALIRSVDLAPGAEVSIEANPEDVTPGWAATMAAAGVTRVSLGVQSFDPVVLASLGRRHDALAARPAIRAIAEAGIGHASVDLIYGAAGETASSWRATLDAALALSPRPDHVSAYALTVEAGTPLAGDRARHPDDDVQAERYETADEVLGAAGLEWYEISNWAMPGAECRHNQNYWQGGDYRGIGCAAHSHRSGRRWWNLRTPERYMAAIGAGLSATAVSEELSEAERDFERLELALRTREGVPASSFADRLAELVSEGLVRVEADRAVLTVRGRLLGNEVACAFPAPPRAVPHQIQRKSAGVPLSSRK
jgi:putative oxygen-independent coproporphyrinogen III oxidase